jgi:hypothetical protein
MSLLYLANFAQVELYYLESGTVLSRQASCSVHCLTATANEPLRMNKVQTTVDIERKCSSAHYCSDTIISVYDFDILK